MSKRVTCSVSVLLICDRCSIASRSSESGDPDGPPIYYANQSERNERMGFLIRMAQNKAESELRERGWTGAFGSIDYAGLTLCPECEASRKAWLKDVGPGRSPEVAAPSASVENQGAGASPSPGPSTLPPWPYLPKRERDAR